MGDTATDGDIHDDGLAGWMICSVDIRSRPAKGVHRHVGLEDWRGCLSYRSDPVQYDSSVQHKLSHWDGTNPRTAFVTASTKRGRYSLVD